MVASSLRADRAMTAVWRADAGYLIFPRAAPAPGCASHVCDLRFTAVNRRVEVPELQSLRVLFVTGMHASLTNRQRGIMICRMAAALGERGHEIVRCDLGGDRGVGRYLRGLPRVRRVVREVRPDLVHVHYGLSGLALPPLHVPVIASFYGDDLYGTPLPSGSMNLRSRAGIVVSQILALRSRRCSVVAPAMVEKLWFRSTRKRTIVLRDHIDARRFRPLSRDEGRRRFGIAADDQVVIFPHSAADTNKRLSLAQAAVASLQPARPRVRLWIVNGEEPDTMPWRYAAADVMIVTSRQESGPSSAKEALACGLPVVSVPVGDTLLFAEAAESVFVALPEPQALACALESALRVAKEPRRARLPSHLYMESAVALLEDLYASAL